MTVRLGAIQASMAATWAHVQSALMSPPMAMGIGGAALQSLHALLLADDEQLHGWWRAAVTLTDSNHPLLLDTLGATQLEQYLLRFSALRDLPEVNALSSLDDIHTVIRDAINIGAPRYNAGDIIGCCTVYWATMMALVSAPVFRGFPGHARAMAPLREIVERAPSPQPMLSQGIDDFAWLQRRAFDAVLALQG